MQEGRGDPISDTKCQACGYQGGDELIYSHDTTASSRGRGGILVIVLAGKRTVETTSPACADRIYCVVLPFHHFIVCGSPLRCGIEIRILVPTCHVFPALQVRLSVELFLTGVIDTAVTRDKKGREKRKVGFVRATRKRSDKM